MNLVVERGRGDLDSLVRQMDRGYLVWGCQGAHTANVETGDFSFVASPGLKIEHGEIVGGVSGALVSGNVMDLLGGVEMVGSDQKDFGSSLMPSMVFRDVRITTG
jgi:PmbA protein